MILTFRSCDVINHVTIQLTVFPTHAPLTSTCYCVKYKFNIPIAVLTYLKAVFTTQLRVSTIHHRLQQVTSQSHHYIALIFQF